MTDDQLTRLQILTPAKIARMDRAWLERATETLLKELERTREQMRGKGWRKQGDGVALLRWVREELDRYSEQVQELLK